VSDELRHRQNIAWLIEDAQEAADRLDELVGDDTAKGLRKSIHNARNTLAAVFPEPSDRLSATPLRRAPDLKESR
jgi:hypothetical protein